MNGMQLAAQAAGPAGNVSGQAVGLADRKPGQAVGSSGRESGERGEGKRGISGSTVKIIAVLAMLIDHIAGVVLTRQVIANGYWEAIRGTEDQLAGWLEKNSVLFYGMQAMRMVGRLGFPIFCFLLVEGFQRSRDVRKYACRLGLFALISELPFNLAVTGSLLHTGYQNVYFTLLLGLFTLCGYRFFERIGQEKGEGLALGIRLLLVVSGVLAPAAFVAVFMVARSGQGTGTLVVTVVVLCAVTAAALTVYGSKRGFQSVQTACADLTVLVAMMFLAEYLCTDYGGMGVLTIAVMYLFRKKRVLAMVAGCVVLTFLTVSEAPAFLAAIPIALYNGKRGLKMKYFFYAFYPVHLLLLYLISVLMGLGGIVLL